MKLKMKTSIEEFFSYCTFFCSLAGSAQDVKENLEAFTEVKTFNGVEVEVLSF